MSWLERNCPDVAVLDVLLREGTSGDVAANLSERGIPFVVCSAGDVQIIDKAFAHGIWVEKPFSETALQAGVREALASYFG